MASKQTAQTSTNRNGLAPLASSKAAAKKMQAGQWHAELGLVIENRSSGARLVKCQRQGPLHIQKALTRTEFTN